MLPGYLGEGYLPYFSPILIQRVNPQKTGKRILRLDFWNVFYLNGLKGFGMDIQILKHTEGYLVADLLYPGDTNDRCAIISHIEFGWLEQHCPTLWRRYPPETMSGLAQTCANEYLNAVYGVKEGEQGHRD